MKELMRELGLPELVTSMKHMAKVQVEQEKEIKLLKGLLKSQGDEVKALADRTQDLEAFNAAPIRETQTAETPEEFAREVNRIIENEKSVMLVYPAGTTDDDKKTTEEMFQPAPLATAHISTSRNGTQLRKMTFASATHARAAASPEVKKYLRNKKVRVERVLTPKQNTRKHTVGVPLAKTIRTSTRLSAHYDGVSMRLYLKDSYLPGKNIDISQFNASNLPESLLDPRLQALLRQAFPPSAPTSPRSPPANSSNQQQYKDTDMDQGKRDRDTSSPTPNKDPKRFAVPDSASKPKVA
jgi:hypothetical protein